MVTPAKQKLPIREDSFWKLIVCFSSGMSMIGALFGRGGDLEWLKSRSKIIIIIIIIITIRWCAF